MTANTARTRGLRLLANRVERVTRLSIHSLEVVDIAIYILIIFETDFRHNVDGIKSGVRVSTCTLSSPLFIDKVRRINLATSLTLSPS